jgi:hypothetical protein
LPGNAPENPDVCVGHDSPEPARSHTTLRRSSNMQNVIAVGPDRPAALRATCRLARDCFAAAAMPTPFCSSG